MVSQRVGAADLPAAVAWVMKRLGIGAADVLGQSREPRVRIQKVVYILRSAGIDAYRVFEYGMYAYGPYSPSLAVIYYMLARKGDEAIDEFASRHRPTRREEELVDWLRGKSVEWLEAAATILMLVGENPGLARSRRRLVKEVRRVKPWLDKRLVDEAARELSEKGLLEGLGKAG